MTTLVARQPLQTLSMSSSQRASRRLSARLQEKQDTQSTANVYHIVPNSQSPYPTNGASTRGPEDKPLMRKKRRIEYEEEEEGFLFTRAKARKSRPSTSKIASVPERTLREKENGQPPEVSHAVHTIEGFESSEPLKKRKRKLSFSTPNAGAENTLRRSKRLSDEAGRRGGSPPHMVRSMKEAPVGDLQRRQEIEKPPERQKTPVRLEARVDEGHPATKIALPLADTPVIRKNKAIREGKGGKGERRSSLGLRGRRASSLIDSGNSNALPHSEVEVGDFYKHIESENLPEPRRMRQLLSWCATRAIGEQSVGLEHAHTGYEDQGARLAARRIEDELLKDFANRSEMSDWFGREDVQKPERPLPLRPNPKNRQNASKIEELEAQIRKLRCERQSLEALLRPPCIPVTAPDKLASSWHTDDAVIDTSLLSSSEITMLESLHASSVNPANISLRINRISTSLGSTTDAFADGVHKIAQYREVGERISSRVLSICAEKLEARDRERRSATTAAAAAAESGDRSDDLMGVLRSLSKIER